MSGLHGGQRSQRQASCHQIGHRSGMDWAQLECGADSCEGGGALSKRGMAALGCGGQHTLGGESAFI